MNVWYKQNKHDYKKGKQLKGWWKWFLVCVLSCFFLPFTLEQEDQESTSSLFLDK